MRPITLRGGVELRDPLAPALGFLEAYSSPPADPLRPTAFGEPDLRLANRGGARISAGEIAAVLERKGEIEAALHTIEPDASLAAASVPWPALTRLFAAFAGIKGVGFSKTTKTLHPKRPALIPMLDSVVQAYLAEEDPGPAEPFGERATALVRGYKRDLDRNRRALQELRCELARRGHRVTDVRLLDLLIWSEFAPR